MHGRALGCRGRVLHFGDRVENSEAFEWFRSRCATESTIVGVGRPILTSTRALLRCILSQSIQQHNSRLFIPVDG